MTVVRNPRRLGPLAVLVMLGTLVSAVGRTDGSISIFHAKTGRKMCVLHGHIGVINDIAYSVSGKRLVSASDDHTVKIWNPRRARLSGPPSTPSHLGPVWMAASWRRTTTHRRQRRSDAATHTRAPTRADVRSIFVGLRPLAATAGGSTKTQ